MLKWVDIKSYMAWLGILIIIIILGYGAYKDKNRISNQEDVCLSIIPESCVYHNCPRCDANSCKNKTINDFYPDEYIKYSQEICYGPYQCNGTRKIVVDCENKHDFKLRVDKKDVKF